eukprot:13996283-Alexandrium_andersonii.AAC.1
MLGAQVPASGRLHSEAPARPPLGIRRKITLIKQEAMPGRRRKDQPSAATRGRRNNTALARAPKPHQPEHPRGARRGRRRPQSAPAYGSHDARGRPNAPNT